MCGGPSSTQLKLQDEEAQFYATQIDAYNTAYSNFKGIQDTLNAQFAPIIAKGPNQFGFSDAEVQNLNSIATEGTARNYGSAQKALQDSIATQGGGTSNVNLTSGATAQMREQLASEAATTESMGQQQIQQAGYGQGHQEWQQAVAGEEDLAAGWNPNSFSGSATGAAGTANAEANTITQQQNSMWGSIIGALGGIGSQAAGGWMYGKAHA
jgi:hypothetical protein